MKFDLKTNKESNAVDVSTYTHRVGRCTRWNNKGIAVNFVTKKDMDNLHKLEKQGNFTIEPITIEEIPNLEERLRAFRETDSK